VSYETTIASAKARAAEYEWNDHKRHCPQCAAAGSKRRTDALCAPGRQLREAMQAARSQLSFEREQDKQPIKGEQPLWT